MAGVNFTRGWWFEVRGKCREGRGVGRWLAGLVVRRAHHEPIWGTHHEPIWGGGWQVKGRGEGARDLADAAPGGGFPDCLQPTAAHGEEVGVQVDGGVVVAGDDFELIAGAQLAGVAVGEG